MYYLLYHRGIFCKFTSSSSLKGKFVAIFLDEVLWFSRKPEYPCAKEWRQNLTAGGRSRGGPG
jgi:hypothetical protein